MCVCVCVQELSSRDATRGAEAEEERQLAELLLENAVVHNNWGSTLESMGDLEQAALQYEEALELYGGLEETRTLGSIREDVANTMNSMGINCYMRGELARSRDHLEKALAIRKSILGPDVCPLSLLLSEGDPA